MHRLVAQGGDASSTHPTKYVDLVGQAAPLAQYWQPQCKPDKTVLTNRDDEV